MQNVIAARRFDSDLLGVIRATRAQKVAPLLILVLNAALLSGAAIDLPLLVLTSSFAVLVSLLGMQLNALTDVELDRATKPELIEQLTRNQQLLRWILWLEGCASVGLWLAILCVSRWAATSTALYALCFVAYSYNFLMPGRAAVARLKAQWWGNMLTVLGGYVSLWLTGFAVAHADLTRDVRLCVVALAVSCLDYGMFLVECAEDAPEERAHGLNTLPALLGRRGTIEVAVGIAALGAACVALLARCFEGASAAALLLVALCDGSALSLAFVTRRHTQRARFGERLADFAFWTSRAGVCALLVYARTLP